MTWRSVIYSKATLALLLLFNSAQLWAGAVIGRIQLSGSRNAIVNKRKDFSGVVVWLTSSENSTPHFARKHVQMIQKDKSFTPHILPIQIGTTVDFPNFDPIFHNAFSNFDGQIFDIGLYPPGSSRSIRFTTPGIVQVFCNIHPSMSAIIVVVDSSYFTTTDQLGNYSFADVAPGAYQVHFFHERATAQTLAQLTQRIVVNDEPRELAAITISEAGYLPVAHKNKYGRDYPAGSDADGYSVPIR